MSRPSCESVVSAWEAVVSEDLDSLGDNSPSVIASLQDQHRPWSWRVYAYKKKQVCNSELYFMRPAFARDTRGEDDRRVKYVTILVIQGTGGSLSRAAGWSRGWGWTCVMMWTSPVRGWRTAARSPDVSRDITTRCADTGQSGELGRH